MAIPFIGRLYWYVYFLHCRQYPVLGLNTDMRSQARVLGSFWFFDPHISRSPHKPYNTRSPPTCHSVLLQPVKESVQPPVICKFTSCTFATEINIALNRKLFRFYGSMRVVWLLCRGARRSNSGWLFARRSPITLQEERRPPLYQSQCRPRKHNQACCISSSWPSDE